MLGGYPRRHLLSSSVCFQLPLLNWLLNNPAKKKFTLLKSPKSLSFSYDINPLELGMLHRQCTALAYPSWSYLLTDRRNNWLSSTLFPFSLLFAGQGSQLNTLRAELDQRFRLHTFRPVALTVTKSQNITSFVFFIWPPFGSFLGQGKATSVSCQE